MDTTEEYILMCEKAEEIQKSWVDDIGDFVKPSNFDEPRFVCDTDVGLIGFGQDGNCYIENCIWLPRMDQLWEMISDDYIQNLWDFYDYMSHGYNMVDPYMMDRVKSIEVGLLMFVMGEKHNKKWNGKDWVKIDV